MPEYDLESVVSDVKKLLRAKLNGEITAVEQEKVAAGFDPSKIMAVADDSYFELAWNDAALNKSPAVGIFLGEHKEKDDAGGGTLLLYTLDIGVVISGTQNDPLSTLKMLRYTRALKAVFKNNWGLLNNAATREKLETIGPVGFTLNVDSSEECKIAGVSLTLTLG